MDPPAGILLDHTQDKIALLDEDGRFLYVNEAVRRILGVEPAALVGENAFERVHPDDVAAARTAFQETIHSESYEESTVEYRYRASDGTWVWLESRMSNVTADSLEGYVVSSREITDRVAAEAERQEVTSRLREIAATSGEVLWLFDSDWSEVLFINPAYEAVYGGSVEDLREDPTSFLDVVNPEDVSRVEEAMARLSAGKTVDIEYRVNPGDDYKRWVWVRGEPIFEDEDVVRIAGFTRDISDRRRRERQLYVMDNLLRHNLRNDLDVIMGTASLIENHAPEMADHAATIRETGENLLVSAEKARRIIEVITAEVSRERYDLIPVIEASVATVQDRYPSATIDTSLPGDCSVFALRELSTALVELIENAVVHSQSPTPSVQVTVEPRTAGVDVVVVDSAPEIPEMEAKVLVGDHEMSDIYHSTGLGFWLVYWVVELSDGRISLERDGDSGNRVTISLPCDRVESLDKT